MWSTSDNQNLTFASLTALVKLVSAARSKIGANSPRKSAPTRLNDSPKYMHCPSTESRRPPTPSCRSRSNVCRNWETWQQMRHTFIHTLFMVTSTTVSSLMCARRTGEDHPPGRPRITWLSTIQHDLRCHNLTHCLKQSTWLRIAVCGGGCGCQALRNLRVACLKRWRRHLSSLCCCYY